jgi:uncharacterized protein (DUF885 family)
MKIPRLFPALAAAGLLSVVATARAHDAAFDRWVDEITAAEMRADPNGATRNQFFAGAEQDALDRRLTPNTKAHRAARVAAASAALEQLARFDRSRLDPQQVVSARVIEWHMQQVVKRDAFTDHAFVFNQFWGLHVTLVNFLTQVHPIRRARDIENYLARLNEVAGQMDEGIAQAREAATRGFLMPDFITRSVLGQLDRFLQGEPAQNVLVTTLAERAARVADLPAADRAAWVAAAEQTVRADIIPAFRRARALLEEQLPLTNPDAGLWRLPAGDDAYATALGFYTTLPLSAREIHETGLKEVARIEEEMDRLLRQLGYTAGTVKERFDQLDTSLQPPAEPDPRPGLIARYQEILDDSVRRAQALFDLQPKAPCVVKREPSFTEKTAAAHYSVPARDGSRPGTFWAPLPGPRFKMLNMRTLTYHEAIPGHHFQIALIQEMTGLPRFRQDRIFGGNSANAEGWALYAEQLAAEHGWYDGDIPGRLGQLEAELFRAKRLVADTGLHAMRWTRQQAIDYGIPAHEVERYVVIPGQACAYKIGQLKILELRAKARRALGAAFDIKQFHNAVLRAGVVPLPVLESIIDDWIAAQGSPTTPATH